MNYETCVRVTDLRVGDLIKSWVDFIPHMRVVRAPQRNQHGVDYETTFGVHYAPIAKTVTVLERGPA